MRFSAWTLIAWSQNLTPERAQASGAAWVSKEELFTRPDVLTIHLVLSERTRGLVNGADIAAMKPRSWLVNTSATAETIIDGWLHSGEVAGRDAEGIIYIKDRIKDMIISGGENIYPSEIEDVLLSHTGIADAAVVGVPSVKWGESPVALVVRADPDLDEAGVLAHCAGRLAR